MHQPSAIHFRVVWANNGDIYDSDGPQLIAGEKARATKRVGHPCNQNIAALKKCARECRSTFTCQIAIRTIAIDRHANVGQLNQAYIAIGVLVFALYSITIAKQSTVGNQSFEGCGLPAIW